MMFTDDTAVQPHLDLNWLIALPILTKFSDSLSFKKNPSTNNHIAYTTNNNYQLEVVDEFTYLRSTIDSKISIDKEIDTWIGREVSTLAWLEIRVQKKKNESLTRPSCFCS